MPTFSTARAVLAAAVWLLTAPLAGALDVGDVRDAIDGRDFHGLEATLSAAHERALEERNFDDLRWAYINIFRVSNPDRMDAVQHWLAAFPTSVYAGAALGYMHLERAFQIRGDAWLKDTSDEALDGFRAEIRKARDWIDATAPAQPDFAPMLDVMLQLHQVHIGSDFGNDRLLPGWEIQWITGRLLDIAPQRETIIRALVAQRAGWNGGKLNAYKDAVVLCVPLADRVPDYTPELCLIEMAFINRATGKVRALAVRALERHDHGFLDYARLDAYLQEWRDRPEAHERAVTLHRQSFGPEMLISTYLRQMGRIQDRFHSPLYEIEAREALEFYARKRLRDDPLNPNWNGAVIEETRARLQQGDPTATRDELYQLWENMRALGAHRVDTWVTGATVQPYIFEDIEARLPFMINQLAYSRHNVSVLVTVMGQLYSVFSATEPLSTMRVDPATDLQALRRKVICPMIRVARLLDLTCTHGFETAACDNRGTASLRHTIRRIAHSHVDCIWMRDASYQDLAFDPVDVPALTKGSN